MDVVIQRNLSSESVSHITAILSTPLFGYISKVPVCWNLLAIIVVSVVSALLYIQPYSLSLLLRAQHSSIRTYINTPGPSGGP